jgi:hypothetical protein
VRFGDLASAAQVLGSVTNSPRPTFGPEEQRLRHAAEQVRAGLGDRADELIERGADLDLGATIDVALAALAALGDSHQAP